MLLSGESMLSFVASLVFVHGLDSNPETAWEKKNSSYVCATSLCAPSLGKEKVNWVLDLLPEDLPDPVRHRTRAFFYNYNYCGQRRRANAVDLLDNLMSLIEIVSTPDSSDFGKP